MATDQDARDLIPSLPARVPDAGGGDGWAPCTWTGEGARFEASEDAEAPGGRVARVSGGPGLTAGWSVLLRLPPGAYRLVFWHRAGGLVKGSAAASIVFEDAAGAEKGGAFDGGSPAGPTWTRRSLRFVVPDAAAGVRVHLLMHRGEGTCDFAGPRLAAWRGFGLSELASETLENLFDAPGLWRPNMYSTSSYDPSNDMSRAEARMVAPAWDAVRDGRLHLPVMLHNDHDRPRRFRLALSVGREPGQEAESAEVAGALAADESGSFALSCPVGDGRQRVRLRAEAAGGPAGETEAVWFFAPRGRVMPPRAVFAPVSAGQVVERFLAQHRAWEAERNADGSWGRGYANAPGYPTDHPLQRIVGRNVLEYISVLRIVRVPLLEQRCVAGLDWLAADQDPSGAFRWWRTAEGTIDINSLYEGGWAGRALVEGYAQFGDARYAQASRREMEWERRTRLAGNVNYNSFSVWHCAGRWQVTGDRQALEHALWRHRESVVRDQLADGAWGRHNAWTGYVAIILRGMTALYAALRKGDPLRPDLRQRAVAALNSLIARQRPDGRVGNSLFDENDATDYSLYAFTGAARDLDLDIVPAIHGVLAHEHAGGGYAAYLEYLARRDAAARDDIAGRLRAALG